MKKLSTFLCLAGMLCLSSSVRAYDFQSGDLYYDITSSAEPYTAAVTYEKQYAADNYAGISDLVIPETVENEGITYSVTSIGDAAFYKCTGLTSVTIPEGVASIGNHAFNSCTGLTLVTIPGSVTSIGNVAFHQCTDLTSVTIPGSVTSIGDNAFDGCTSLTLVTISDGVTSIGNNAFTSCTGLTSITIPGSVTSIGKAAFAKSGLTSITISDGVASIGNMAFSNCKDLTAITVAPGNPIYDSRNNCNAIVETGTHTLHIGCSTTVIPESVTSIGDNAFNSCTGLTSVTIPEGVTSIGNNAFNSCTGLTSVTIPEGVTSIGDYAFAYCTGLETIISYAATPPACGMYAFEQVPAEASVYVPCKAVTAYKSDATWSQFTGIRCIEDIPSAMEHTGAEPAAVQKTVLEGKVVILREGKTYDLLGREVR